MTQNSHSNFPWNHVIGFILSIALTLLSVWIALYTSLSITAIIWIIVSLAIIQAGIQLFMFMHIREGEGGAQVFTMVYSAIIGVIIVAGTIWVINSMMHSMSM
ncbi:cytochrome aa3 quinol oxidase subunit IV [Pontibacillus yanchengensis]|uniref:Quinol oxidase subunit 4 n=1 Tax=Pontibacillus yanchengensis Y32 TaxID=1385514 RepID=A0A0A2TSU5_9BACI|nr:cytochrome aa3 quinol oxidase subunit IV [Pontibacillus yanchengensis]KGP72305.1 quinol oxidase subunit 4 [Pontibacillus yanchengensis Y32]